MDAQMKGTRAGDRIEHLKKGDMAEKAQELLAGSGWLPEPLRTPGHFVTTVDDASAVETGQSGGREVEDTADDGGETAMAETGQQIDEPAEIDMHVIAAE